MARQIDTDAVINSIRLAEQASDVGAIAAGYWQLYAKEGGLYLEDDNEVVGGPLGAGIKPSGRLTLTTATPITTADVTAAATIYYTHYKGNQIGLWDGARRIPVTYTEKSLSIAAFTASKVYDIFGYLSSGTLALEGLVWTNDTTRATALAYSSDGWLSKNGALDRLYLGTIYINSSGGQTDDSLTKRNVYNYYNRVMRRVYLEESTGHNYNSTAQRYWNNDATQLISFVQGVLAEEPVQISMKTATTGSATGPTSAVVVASLDWTAGAPASSDASILNSATASMGLSSSMIYQPAAAGKHHISIIQYATAANNVAFTNHRTSGFVMA